MHPICNFAYRSTTRYWYHPDHLGSASWVSDKAGKGIQHLYYLPWGEELDNQRATDYASRYTFSGKERDVETGYGYFGARYYHSDLSIWLSVDPMADKYPSTSPYTYCANNPVRLVDPDGREFGEYFDMDGNWLGSDGRNDFKIHFVDDPESQAQLRRDATNHRFTTSDVKIKFSTNYFVLSEINDVYDRTLSNGGVCEEGCAFQDEGVCYRSDRGTNRHVELKISHGLISIHSHSFDIVDENDPNKIVGIGIPEKPSGRDEAMFKRFKLNVIVGETQCDPNVNGCERYPRAYFYDSSCNNILKLDIPSIKKVVESYNSVKIGIRNANYTP